MKWRDHKGPCFRKLDVADWKWTRGRSYFTLPGRVIVTPTNFKNVSHLDLEDYSYNYFYRNSDSGSKVVSDEFFQYESHDEFSDLEAIHLSETKACMTREYDLSVLRKLASKWDSRNLRKYLEYYRRTSRKADFQRSSLVYAMFTPVVAKHCSDSILVVEFYKSLCSHLIACESLFMGSTMFLKLFLEHASKVGFDPWSLMRKFQRQKDSPVVKFCPVEWSLIHGKLEHLELLLKYGCPFHVSNYSASGFNKKIDGKWWNRNGPAAIVMPGSTPSLSSPTDFCQSSAYAAHFTVVLYLTASNAVISRDDNRFDASIRLFMRSVPQPYVSADAMSNVVGHLAPTLFPIVGMSCDWYRHLFPEDIAPQPRSLLHLSRCAVRSLCALPHGIGELPLPAHLRSHLNLEW